ncbi:SUMF1/EgtB/PvdO family nonheme iron enzyme [Candidatus Magnetaquicoccus inordinatus]|uniref:SUMF1/EgtB/PvdO family nonheme iron enzyme n=1 Tax=Candidatus Magnetaquicoccus inordinatus TaxID=2496818 RepID=UPI00102B5673|nr:SUMF1/EgtB/PvdO family nonheme iron enzyme [Candidatus Magnetaquicoccus inordinatus]
MECTTALVGRYKIRDNNQTSSCPELVPADDTSSGVPVDLQWLPATISSDPLHMAEIRHYVQLLHALDHPHIARLHTLEYDPQQRAHYLVWEQTSTLSSLHDYRLSQPGQRLSCKEALAICRDIASALDSLHRSMLHRHLRPENLFLTEDGIIKMACIPLLPVSLQGKLQQIGTLPTPVATSREQIYLAPELWAEHRPEATPASDRWALSVLFYELVSASLPFTAEQKMTHHPTPHPVPALNKASHALLAKALAPLPEDRFASAQAFIHALSAASVARKSKKRSLFLFFLLLVSAAITLLWHDPWQSLQSLLPSANIPASSTQNITDQPVLTPDIKKTLLLQIESQPSAATVILDGKRLGQTPFTVGRVAPGAYHLWLEKEGFQPVEMEMDLTQDTIVSLKLETTTNSAANAEEKRGEAASWATEHPLRVAPLLPADAAMSSEQTAHTTADSAGTPPVWQDPLSGLSFVQLPGGCFTMGSTQGNQDEKPLHKVCVDPFWLGQHEVTQAAWQKIMADEALPARFRSNSALPVDSISWQQAQRFIARLNAQSSFRFRLPSEAEWEYACRGGAQTSFQFGNTIHAGKANFNGQKRIGEESKGYYVGSTMPAGSFPANRFALFDMHGNLYEWVSDLYRADFYQHAPQNNPVASLTENEQMDRSERVLRGGAWYSTPMDLRCAARHKDNPQQTDHGYGFRLLREP